MVLIPKARPIYRKVLVQTNSTLTEVLMKIGIITIASFIFSLSMPLAFAGTQLDFDKVDLKNFTLDYRDSKGAASFEKLEAKVGDFSLSFKDYQVDLQKDQGKILFQKDDTSLLIEQIQGSVLDSVTVLSLDNASLYVEPEARFKFHMDGGEFELGDGVQSLGQMSMECKSERGRNGDILSFLRPCFTLGHLSIPFLNISEFSKDSMAKVFPIEEIENQDFSEQIKKIKGPDSLKDIKLFIANNRYNLSLKTKFVLKLKLKMEGKAEYQEAQNRIVFSVDKAKIGFFSVRKLVLKEIQKAGIKNVQVFGYNIIINL
ncbi:MAG: hypothetical protein ACJAT2_002082 [Bacteriovoracaceae bacterium]|jgi:hypothetical protein